MTSTKIYLSTLGRPVDPEHATLGVLDRGFLFGDSVFETQRTARGRPVAWAQHLARLRRSAAGLGIAVPWSDAELTAIADATHTATGNPESVLRVIVTRGGGPLLLDPRRAGPPTLIVLALPLQLPAEADYVRGLRARLVDAIKVPAAALDPTIKTGNYLPNLQALRLALDAGDDDAILRTPAGDVAEGATSNVFAVVAGGLRTPPVSAGILPGITRAIVLGLAAGLGLPAREARLAPDELRAADEVFLTSSVRGPIAVAALDGRPVGPGREGPITARVRRRYAAYLEETVSEDMSSST